MSNLRSRTVRDTYKYHFKVSNKIVHRGITTDIKRREQEHLLEYPDGCMERRGCLTTDEAAREWEIKEYGIKGERK